MSLLSIIFAGIVSLHRRYYMPIRTQRFIAFTSILLFLGKIWAWYITGSVAILTDALESTVNVITGFIGLYAVILASKPRDENHPYGHGKVEFVSAAIEGGLIFLSGLMIIYEAINHLLHPETIQELNTGIILILVTGIINFLLGTYAIQQGNKNRSATLKAAGQHLKTDAYSTFLLFAGLIVLRITGLQWIDSMLAFVFSAFIIITGYRVIRTSMAGIMDEMDVSLLKEVIILLQKNRKEQWIDMHNLRVMHYGEIMHLDAHMTLPWYYTVQQADIEIHGIADMVKGHFGNKVEIFIHLDACKDYQCKLCAVENCEVRKQPFESLLIWNEQNVWENSSHG